MTTTKSGLALAATSARAVDVRVLAVACLAEQQREARAAAQVLREVGKPRERRGVVREIDDQVEPAELVAHQAPGIVGGIRAEAREHRRHDRGIDAEPGRTERGSREVRDVEVRMAAGRERHRGDGAEVVLDARVEQHEAAFAHAGGGAAGPAVCREQRMIRVLCEPAERLARRRARRVPAPGRRHSRPAGRGRRAHARPRA